MATGNMGGKQVTGEAASTLEAAVNNLNTAALQKVGKQPPKDRPYRLVILQGLNETTIRHGGDSRVRLSDAEEGISSNQVEYTNASTVELRPDEVSAQKTWGTSFLTHPSSNPYARGQNRGTIEGNEAAGAITKRLYELSQIIGAGVVDVEVQFAVPQIQ